jgi:hypothetical protein
MEQKDYLLREIEKIGMVLRAILQRILGSNNGFQQEFEKSFAETNELLIQDANFDLDKFLLSKNDEFMEDFEKLKGFNFENIELLADIVFQMGLTHKPEESMLYFEKSLELLGFCNKKSKTFSIERERKMQQIMTAISQYLNTSDKND